MSEKLFRVLLVSDFNIQNLAALMIQDKSSPSLEVDTANYSGGVIAPAGVDLGVSWTMPENVIPGFKRILNFESVSDEEILADVDNYFKNIERFFVNTPLVFLPLWQRTSSARFFAVQESKSLTGAARALALMNLRLMKNAENSSRMIVLDSDPWFRGDADAFNPKLWYMGKIAFGREVFSRASHQFKATLRNIYGQSKKLILVDLDDTLWGGLVGEEGWENLKLGGHDPLGEAFADFQKALKAMTKRGILIGIISKNNETTALDAISRHPEMALKISDFSGWKINWNDKSDNIKQIAAELKLGLDSVVFIDDSPVERSRVKEALPEVFVPDWPEDKMLYKNALLSLDCFDAVHVNAEDKNRIAMYRSEKDRVDLKKDTASYGDWLKGLDMTVHAEALTRSNLPRAAQLLNKTNQMNLSTRRLSEEELFNWASYPEHLFFTFRVSDKFGDSGLTGLVSLKKEAKAGRIIDFVLSCRVLGRGVEEMMLNYVSTFAIKNNLNKLIVEYRATLKNSPCLDFFNKSRFLATEKNHIFYWELKSAYPAPPEIRLE